MWSLIKQTVREFIADSCPQMAAALSYYTIFSLAPLLVITIALCGLVFDPEQVQGRVYSELSGLVGENGADPVRTMIEAAEEPGEGIVASVISIVLLVVGAIGLVIQLQTAMNRAWGVRPAPKSGWRHFIFNRLLSLAMLVGLAFTLMVSLILTAMVSAFGDWMSGLLGLEDSAFLLQGLNNVVTLLVVALIFAAMYRFLPDARIRWSTVAVGALATALLFVIGKFAMGMYLGSRNMESAYGAAGSLALILIWVYYNAMIFLLGAEFTEVWAKRRGEGIIPDDHAVRVVEEVRTVAP